MCLSRIGGVRRKHLEYLAWKDTMILASLGSSVCGETYVTESFYGESEGLYVVIHPSLFTSVVLLRKRMQVIPVFMTS